MPRANRTRGYPQSRYGLGNGSSKGRIAEWELDAEDVWSAVKAVLVNGDAILFGATSDGGAVRVAVYCGDDPPEKGYAADVTEFTTLLTTLSHNAQG